MSLPGSASRHGSSAVAWLAPAPPRAPAGARGPRGGGRPPAAAPTRPPKPRDGRAPALGGERPRPEERRLPVGRDHIAPEQAGERRDAGVEDRAGAVRSTEDLLLELPVPEVEEVVRRPLERPAQRRRRLDGRTPGAPGFSL